MMIHCKSSAEVAPFYRLERESVVLDGDVSTEVFEGCNVEVTSGSDAQNQYSILELVPQTLDVANESGDTDISAYPTLRPNGSFEGEDTVMLSRGGFKRPVHLDFSVQAGSESKRVSGLADGPSYMRYSFEWLEALLAGEGSMQVYTGTNRNTGCWAAAEDLTGVPYSSAGSAQRNSAPITRRHLTGVRHFLLSEGDPIVFKNASNISFTYTIIGVSSASSITGDAVVYTLDRDLDPSIKVYPVAGRWLHVTDDSGGSFETIRQLIGLFVNQDRAASFLRISYYDYVSAPKVSGTISGTAVADAITTVVFDAWFDSQVLPELDEYAAYRIGARGGDSGSAVFVPVEGGLALASNFTSYAEGPFWDEDFVNALIISADADAGVSTGYSVTVAPDPLA